MRNDGGGEKRSRQKPEDTSRRCDVQVAQKKKQLLNGCFLLLCVLLILPNKLHSAALKRREEGND